MIQQGYPRIQSILPIAGNLSRVLLNNYEIQIVNCYLCMHSEITFKVPFEFFSLVGLSTKSIFGVLFDDIITKSDRNMKTTCLCILDVLTLESSPEQLKD